MRKAEYEAYITSPQWRHRKIAYYAKNSKICQGCESKTNIHLHHHTYERVGGTELDDDLVPLCGACHALVHRYHSSGGKNLTVCTFEVIAYLNGKPLSQHVAQRVQKAQAATPGKKDPINKALAGIRERRRQPTITLLEAVQKFGLPKKVLRYQGYHHKIPLDVVQRWMDRESHED